MKKKARSKRLLSRKCLPLSGIHSAHPLICTIPQPRPTHTQTPAGQLSKRTPAQTPVEQWGLSGLTIW